MLRIFLHAVIVLLLLGSQGSARAGVMLDRVVAVINNEAITWSELYKAMEFELTRNQSSISDEEKRKLFKENEASFLESMIDVKLQVQEAEKLNIRVSEKEVEAAIMSIREKYSMEEEEFRRVINEEGFTPEKYRELLKEQIIIRKVIDSEIRDKVNVTDDDVNAYLQRNNLSEGTQYTLRQIFLKHPETAEEESALREKLDLIRKELAAGVDFAMVAARYSDDPAASSTGGDLGVIESESLSEEFLSALEDLIPGNMSDPFRSAQGVHILKVEDRKTAREVIFERRFNEQYSRWVKGLRSKSFIDIRL